MVEPRAESQEVTIRQFTTAHYAAIVSTVAFFVSCGSFYVSKISYDLSAAKDQRERRDKMPAIDVQDRTSTSRRWISRSNIPLKLEICTFPLLSRASIY